MDGEAALGNAFGHGARGRWVETQTFADHGLEVGKVHGFGVGDGGGDAAVVGGGVDFVAEGGEGGRVGDQLEHGEADGVGG